MLILASQSPRRSQLLKSAGIPFVAKPANVDETVRPGEGPEDYSKRLAQQKAMAIEAAPGDIVLGADTVVVIDREILGKPRDPDDAARMLELLSGRKLDWAVTLVWFLPLTLEEIGDYVASGEPMDKAGAYAIQGLASKFVQRIDGSYTNVVGLPIEVVYKHLRKWEA